MSASQAESRRSESGRPLFLVNPSVKSIYENILVLYSEIYYSLFLKSILHTDGNANYWGFKIFFTLKSAVKRLFYVNYSSFCMNYINCVKYIHLFVISGIEERCRIT